MPHVNSASGSDDFGSTDEVKVYKEEGEVEEEQRESENLSEDKLGLVTETEEGKGSDVDVKNSYSTDENSNGTLIGAKISDYPLPDRLPFGYPIIPPYPYTSGASLVTSPGKLFGAHPGLGFYMYNGECLSQPPPAHMGISSLRIDPKTGLPRHPMYGIPASSGQLPHPLYGPDFSQMQAFDMLARSSPSSAFCPSPYPPPPIGWFGQSSILAPHPGFPYPSFNHAAVVTPGVKQELSPLSESLENCRRLPGHPAYQFHNHHYRHHMHHLPGDRSPSLLHAQRRSVTPPHKSSHIKKPLNAFMIFMKEMRQSVIDECTLKESAAINQILGRRWHALDRSEQQKYYDMARKEKELHLQLYPGWSARDNYATHTKKKKVPTATLR